MDQNSVLRRLTPIFQDVLDQSEINLTLTTTAREVDGWDSIAHIRLMLAIEESFAVKFDVGEFQSYRNIGDLVGGILKRQAGRN